MVDRGEISTGWLRAWRRRRRCLLISDTDESCTHHLSNTIDFGDIRPLFSVDDQTFRYEKTKLNARRIDEQSRELRRRDVLPSNRNSLVKECNPKLRSFDAEESDWDFPRRTANDGQPSSRRRDHSAIEQAKKEIYFVENTTQRPDIRSKIITEIMFVNTFRRHVISKCHWRWF